MKVKIKRVHINSVIPRYAIDGDAGLDLTAVSATYFDDQIQFDTGIAIEIPTGYVGLVFPRSSISKKDLTLSNSVGVIDSNYRGTIKAVFNLKNPWFQVYNVGDKIAQLVIVPYPKIEFEQVSELSTTKRAEGGFGSTDEKK